jgi:hypothetical protein
MADSANCRGIEPAVAAIEAIAFALEIEGKHRGLGQCLRRCEGRGGARVEKEVLSESVVIRACILLQN